MFNVDKIRQTQLKTETNTSGLQLNNNDYALFNYETSAPVDNLCISKEITDTGKTGPSAEKSQELVSNGEEGESSVRAIDLLSKKCPPPTYSNIGTDKNLQCATYKYKVQQGDNIYRLALRYGIDWKTLLADNNMTEKSVLKIDDEININKIVYTVQSGDNLTQIAKKYGLTVDYIRDANNLENADKLEVNQKLEFPGFVYTVKKGDNLTQISKRVGINVTELGKLNNIESPYIIQPNQKLLILFNDTDYNVSDSNKTTRVDEKGNTITTIKSDNTLLAGREYLIPKKVNNKYKASRHIFQPTGSGKLNGKTIIVNAGHGYKSSGTLDIGTEGKGGLDDEWIINYDNAMRLIAQLNKRGAKVIFLQGAYANVKSELGNYKNVDMFISVHVNSVSSGSPDRTQFYYRNSLKNDNSWGTRSKKLAEIAEKKFDKWIPANEKINDNEKFYNDGIQDYAQSTTNDNRTGMLSNAIKYNKAPSIIWEVAFMSSPKGRERLSNSSLMESYASVMSNAVEEYFDTYKNKPTATNTSSKSNSDYVMHTVKKGETLGGIAKKNGVTIEQLKKLNGLKSNNIKIGQKLKIKKK